MLPEIRYGLSALATVGVLASAPVIARISARSAASTGRAFTLNEEGLPSGLDGRAIMRGIPFDAERSHAEWLALPQVVSAD